MSTLERLVWAICGAVGAIAIGIGWWRDEMEMRREQRRHEAEMQQIRAGLP